MRSSVLLVAAAAGLASALPTSEREEIALLKRNYIESLTERTRLAKRQSVTSGVNNDGAILNFALTLEHLESAFYSQALTKFDSAAFDSAGYKGAYALLQQVAADEAQHVTFLTTALQAAGATPVQACTYNFPYNTTQGFLGISQVLEGVGVSAYLGAAGAINNTAYLTAAGSILTVEARHAAFVRFLNEYSPFPSPEDTPISAAGIVTLATPFFASCPAGSAPSIAGHPALTLSTAAPAVGQPISITVANASVISGISPIYCGFASGLGAGFSQWSNNQCTVPTQNVTNGQTYVFLTKGPSVSDASVIAGPAFMELGPKNFTVVVGSGGSGGSGGASGTSSGAGASTTTRSGATSTSAKLSFVGAVAFIGGALALLF